MSFSRSLVICPSLITSRRPPVCNSVQRKIRKNFRFRASSGADTSVSYAATLETRQQCCFLKSNVPNAAAVLLFQMERCKRRNSVSFSKLTLQTPQQCSFFNTSIGIAVGVFVFQNQRS